MTTARSIIKKALLKIGALVKSEDPAADEANDALDSLNALIASWSNDSAVIYARTWETFPLTSASTYTIGTGGDFNTDRPLNIADCYLKDSTIDYDMEIISAEAYDSISYKSLQGIPEFLNFDNGYPLARIRLYPVPSASYSLFLLTEKAVTGFTTLDTVLSLPPGWERALIYNLAIDLAPEYNQEPSQAIVEIAKESLGMVRIGVIKNRPMDAFPQNVGVRNIYSGWRY